MSVMLAGYHGNTHRKPWETLLSQVDETWSVASEIRDLLARHDPKLLRTYRRKKRLILAPKSRVT